MYKKFDVVLISLLFVACASVDGPGSGSSPGGSRPEAAVPRVIPDAVPKTEPRSKRGNPESYVVLGKRYFVLPTSHGYVERGIASWYGTKFHGRTTSNGEIYNMYAMSAAHKSLPLPAYVHVTNLKNGLSAVVRVNDRGPFHGNRIIDLSYAAAQKLDMLHTGTALVEVRVVSADGEKNISIANDGSEIKDWRDESHLLNRIYIQIGAFNIRDNAERLLARLQQANFTNVEILDLTERNQLLHRVRIGPLSSVALVDRAVGQLQSLGLGDHQIVIE